MRREGDLAELVAYMLELATIPPSDDAAFAVGAQPVLVLWGHATEGQAVPEGPNFAVPPPVTPARRISSELPFETAADAAPLPVPAATIAPVASATQKRRTPKPSPRWARRGAVPGSPGCCRCFCCCCSRSSSGERRSRCRRSSSNGRRRLRHRPRIPSGRTRQGEGTARRAGRVDQSARRTAGIVQADHTAITPPGAGRAARATESHRARSSSATAEAETCATGGRAKPSRNHRPRPRRNRRRRRSRRNTSRWRQCPRRRRRDRSAIST